MEKTHDWKLTTYTLDTPRNGGICTKVLNHFIPNCDVCFACFRYLYQSISLLFVVPSLVSGCVVNAAGLQLYPMIIHILSCDYHDSIMSVASARLLLLSAAGCTRSGKHRQGLEKQHDKHRIHGMFLRMFHKVPGISSDHLI